MSNNKVKFNLKNVHAAIQTRDGSGGYSYGTPIAIPGAVSLSLEAKGETTPFYADGLVYYRSVSNNGYSGDLEIALIPEWFREQVLKEIKDNNGVLIENNNDLDPVYFALLFEFDGDKKAIRHVMYNCTVSTRPTVDSKTKEENVDPGTEKLSISADPRDDGLVKAKTGDSTNVTAYNAWYESVYIPSISAARLSALSIGSLVLSPTFSANTTAYTAATSNASDAITATAANSADVAIEVDGSTVVNGAGASWNVGSNTVTITVSKTGLTTTTYTVTVTRAAG